MLPLRGGRLPEEPVVGSSFNFTLNDLIDKEEEEKMDDENERRTQNIVGMCLSKWNLDKNNQCPKRLTSFTKPLEMEEVPQFQTLEEFHKFLKLATLQRKLTFDQSRFITEKYSKKRVALAKNIKQITDGIWSKIPELSKRLEYANCVNLLITYTEMFHWIGTAMENEFQNGIHSFISCEVIDMFTNYFETVKKCITTGVADVTNFAHLLLIRDRIVEALRDHFHIILPMSRKQKIEEYVPDTGEKYQPFDYEWLSGTVISGRYQVPFEKFLAIERTGQVEMSCIRAGIIAAKRQEETNFLRNIRIPFPRTVDNANLLEKSVQASESRLRQDYVRLYKILAKDRLRNEGSVIFIQSMEQFNELCGVVRIKKRKIMDELVHCEAKNMKPKLRAIAILSSLDAIMLILQKVFALYVDRQKGMLGVNVPSKVLFLIAEIYKLTTVERCRAETLDSQISKHLEALRIKTHEAIRTFYLKKEAVCHKYYTQPEGELPQKLFVFEMDISEDEYPDALSSHASRMVWILQEQQKEMFRLNRELHKAKRSADLWPTTEDTVKFITNTCPGICAFYSNFETVIDEEKVCEVLEVADKEWRQVSPECTVGTQLIIGAQELMKKYNAVPHCVEIRVAFENEFYVEIRRQRINGLTYKQLAAEYSLILNQEIDITNARIRWQSKKQTGSTALRIARRMVGLYLDYVCEYMKPAPIRLRSGPPTPIPDDDLPTEEVVPPEVQRLPYDADMHILSDTESDYNTDEGPEDDRDELEDELDDEEEDDDDADEGNNVFNAEDAARMAILLNALSMDALSNVVFVQQPDDEELEDVPDEVIDNFIRNVRGVLMDPDMSAPHFNVPLD